MADYWDTNSIGVSMIIGIPAYRFKNPATPAFASPEMIGRQIGYTRSKNNVQGHFYFRTENLSNPELNTYLKPLYTYKSLIPEYGNLKFGPVANPRVKLKGNKITWSKINDAKMYAVYVLDKETPGSITPSAKCIDIIRKNKYKGQKGKSYIITAAGKGNVESKASEVVTIR